MLNHESNLSHPGPPTVPLDRQDASVTQPFFSEQKWNVLLEHDKQIYLVYLQEKFGVKSIRENEHELTAAVYLQVSIISQALIFVTRSRSWSFVERPGFWLAIAFLLAQFVSPEKQSNLNKHFQSSQLCIYI